MPSASSSSSQPALPDDPGAFCGAPLDELCDGTKLLLGGLLCQSPRDECQTPAECPPEPGYHTSCAPPPDGDHRVCIGYPDEC